MKEYLVAAALSVGLMAGAADALPVDFDFSAGGGDGAGLELSSIGDFYLVMTGNDNGAASITTAFTSTMTYAYDVMVSFSWNYITTDIDGSFWDSFGFFVDGSGQTLTIDDPRNDVQGGNFSFLVSAGQTFGFFILSKDGMEGAAMASIFGEVDPAPVPLPAGGLLLLGAIGGLAAVRRRKAA